jgi:[ribosomal protein S5]-alanine N-acetyltransferase
MFEPVVIDTLRLRLRPLRQEDAPTFFDLWSDPETVRYFSFPPMQNIEEAHARVAERVQSSQAGTIMICVIEAKDTGEVLGDCGLHNGVVRCQRAEIGYCLAPKYRGKGYMSEAVGALIDHGFEKLGLNRIEADIHPQNAASIQLAERLGFRRE